MAAPVDLELKKAFTELQAKVIDTQQKVKLADIQIEQLNRTKKHAHLTDTEIMTLVDETNMYEGVGRMFILQSKEVIHSQLLEKQKIAEEKIKELEQKKSYLERSVKEAEDNIREMLMARRAQQEISSRSFLPPPIPGKGRGAHVGKQPLFYPDGLFIWMIW
ncbi:prefoldin subunit 1-like [Neovison vison]|nr:prefoldin subunit 1-like [Neogale vison]